MNVDVKQRLSEYNIRPSVQRMAVMDYLLRHKTHPTVDEIYEALLPQIPTLSKTTIYNTLRLFVEKGAALKLVIEDKNERFDGDISLHAHFICQRCGGIRDIFLPEVPQIADINVKEVSGCQITSTELYYRGYCPDCKGLI